MAAERVTVLGGGNTSFSLAANLALAGHAVLLWEHPDFAAAIAPILDSRAIHLDGTARTGHTRLAVVTTDAAEALAWSDTVLIPVPSYAHAPFLAELAPHLRPGQLLALLPGNLGTLALATALRAAGIEGVVLAEADTAPYVCRKTAPDRAVIWGEVPNPGIGVFPGTATDAALATLRPFFPGATAYPSVLAAGLSALNPIVHPPGVLLNAGRIERSRGDFWFYEEGVTPAVVAAIEALDRERLALGAALGLDLLPVSDGFHRAGFGPAGDLWAVINGSCLSHVPRTRRARSRARGRPPVHVAPPPPPFPSPGRPTLVQTANVLRGSTSRPNSAESGRRSAGGSRRRRRSGRPWRCATFPWWSPASQHRAPHGPDRRGPGRGRLGRVRSAAAVGARGGRPARV